jgi:gamma-glutamyltranspeptidase/glutathione hydrolase
MGHNSPDYLHTVLEALKLAFADRHAYYGDPDFVDVPMEGLLSKAYAADRRDAIDASRACPEMPLAGDPWRYQNGHRRGAAVRQPVALAGGSEDDTTHICVVDRWGNAFGATPSDGIGSSPIVPGLGFVISARGSQTWLDPEHPCALAPGKRPRLTPNPAMAFKDGQLWMPFGTPGGDVQCQSMTQLFLNVAEFGMDPQQAIEAPRVSTWSFPNSFWPHAYHPGLVGAEERIDRETVAELERRGHKVELWDEWTPKMGSLCAIQVDRKRGTLSGGADLRRDAYAIGR